MKSETQTILNEIVETLVKNIDLYSLIQFGSSTTSENPADIDLLLITKFKVISAEDRLKILEIIEKLEEKYPEVVFDFSGSDREKEGEIQITLIPQGLEALEVQHQPHEKIFFKDLSQDPNLKILFGVNPLVGKDYHLTFQDIFEMLTIDLHYCLRKSLDGDEKKFHATNILFKRILREMLFEERHIEKDNLIETFKEKYPQILLPKNVKKILDKSISEEEFKEVLKFGEDCMNYLMKVK